MNSFLVFINFMVNSFTKVNHFTRVYTYTESSFFSSASLGMSVTGSKFGVWWFSRFSRFRFVILRSQLTAITLTGLKNQQKNIPV